MQDRKNRFSENLSGRRFLLTCFKTVTLRSFGFLWNSCLDCESVIPLSFHRNRGSTVSFIRSPCDTERLTMSWTNCQLKMRLVHIKHPCKMKVKDQNYRLYQDFLYLPNFARLEKFYYVHTLSNYLPSLQGPPFPCRVRPSFPSSFEDLTFLTDR